MQAHNVLIVPGWYNSGPDHWQSLWQAESGYIRVEQHDWERPLRGDWMSQLEEAVLATTEPAVLVAHSLGCLLVAAWAAHSQNVHRVKAVLLVAPGDAERDELQGVLRSWSPIERRALPFGPERAVLIGSSDDPYCSLERAQQMAADWQARWVLAGALGHINAESGVGAWPQGREWLARLMND